MENSRHLEQEVEIKMSGGHSLLDLKSGKV